MVAHRGQVDDGISVGACAWVLQERVAGVDQRPDSDVLEDTEGADRSRAGRVRVVAQDLPLSSVHEHQSDRI